MCEPSEWKWELRKCATLPRGKHWIYWMYWPCHAKCIPGASRSPHPFEIIQNGISLFDSGLIGTCTQSACACKVDTQLLCLASTAAFASGINTAEGGISVSAGDAGPTASTTSVVVYVLLEVDFGRLSEPCFLICIDFGVPRGCHLAPTWDTKKGE